MLKIMRDVPSCGSTLFSSFPIIRHVKIASVTAAGASVLDSCIVQVCVDSTANIAIYSHTSTEKVNNAITCTVLG